MNQGTVKYFRKLSLTAYLPVVCLMGVLLSILLFIEYQHPYFFLQDDNRDSYLPYFVHNYRSLLQDGEIALYNFHQYLGIPSLATGQAAALYPPSYLAVFASQAVFGQVFAAIDIQVICHLLIAGLGVYALAKFFACDTKAAFFAGLTWPLSSFVMYASNSWVIVATVAAMFPWMLVLSLRQYKSPTRAVSIYLTVVRLALFYSGNVQYFVYSVCFECLTVLLYIWQDALPGTRKARFRTFFKRYITGYMYVTVLALPLLLPMWHLISTSAARSSRLLFSDFVDFSFPVDQLLLGLVYPFFQLNATVHSQYSTLNLPIVSSIGFFLQKKTPFKLFNLGHIGYGPLIIVSISCMLKYTKRTVYTKIQAIPRRVFIYPAILAFLWSSNWIFNALVYCIPILNRFRWPFKLALYFDFYLLMLSALLLSQFIIHFPWRAAGKKILFGLLLTVQIAEFLFLYTMVPHTSFADHQIDPLPLQEQLIPEFGNDRIASLGFDIWKPTLEGNRDVMLVPTLGYNYATLFGLNYISGYDLFLPPEKDSKLQALGVIDSINIVKRGGFVPVEDLRKLAVRWYIVPADQAAVYINKFQPHGITKKYEDANRAVFYDAKAYPMVFNDGGEDRTGENYRVKTNSIELTVNCPRTETLRFNYSYDPFFKGFIDGREVGLNSVNTLNFSMVVPPGKHTILIRYTDPYCLAGVYSVIAVFIMLLIIRFSLSRWSYGKNKGQVS